MCKILEQVKYCGQLLLIPIYGISFLFPRDKNIWVFGSTFGKRFADNPKYFYLYVSQMESSRTRAIWITKNREVFNELQKNGYEAYLMKSLKGIYYSLRAGVYFFDNYTKDICFWLSGRAIKINLWHGIPLKKIQMDNQFDKVRHPENKLKKAYWFIRRLSDEKPSHYVLATSKALVPIFSSAFNTNKVLIANYPRNDNLLVKKYDTIYSDEELESLAMIQSGKWNKVLLYMPTFRNTEEKFFDIITIEYLVEYLKKNNILMCVKLHPKSKMEEKFQLLKCNNILVLTASADPYTILGEVDVLITDYSSIYFDYLVTDKPIIFFDYDRNEYIKESRELYKDYDNYTPGRKVKNMFDLIEAINNIEEENEFWKEERKRIRNEVFEDLHHIGSKQLYDIVTKII